MIERHWKGIADHGKAHLYIRHLKEETFPELEKIPGFKGSSILYRECKEGTEFLIVTRWENIGSIQQFAGEACEESVVPDKVKAMMVQYDSHVKHFILFLDDKEG